MASTCGLSTEADAVGVLGVATTRRGPQLLGGLGGPELPVTTPPRVPAQSPLDIAIVPALASAGEPLPLAIGALRTGQGTGVGTGGSPLTRAEGLLGASGGDVDVVTCGLLTSSTKTRAIMTISRTNGGL
jgi:hypothetical protein